jgi:hypothetical protein
MKYKRLSPQREAELREMYSLKFDRNDDNCQKEYRGNKAGYVSYHLAKEKGVTNV